MWNVIKPRVGSSPTARALAVTLILVHGSPALDSEIATVQKVMGSPIWGRENLAERGSRERSDIVRNDQHSICPENPNHIYQRWSEYFRTREPGQLTTYTVVWVNSPRWPGPTLVYDQ
jgi:hypothetical protein